MSGSVGRSNNVRGRDVDTEIKEFLVVGRTGESGVISKSIDSFIKGEKFLEEIKRTGNKGVAVVYDAIEIKDEEFKVFKRESHKGRTSKRKLK